MSILRVREKEGSDYRLEPETSIINIYSVLSATATPLFWLARLLGYARIYLCGKWRNLAH
jgi:hypothetical protein